MVKKIMMVVLVVGLLCGCVKNNPETPRNQPVKETNNVVKIENNKEGIQKVEVVWKNGIIEEGLNSWKRFIRNTQLGIRDQIVIEKSFLKGEEEMGDSTDPYDTFYSRIEYDGKNYILIEYNQFEDSAIGEGGWITKNNQGSIKSIFKHLIELTNEKSRYKLTETENPVTYYYLVDDDKLTYDKLVWSELSGNAHDHIYHQMIFWIN